MVRVKLISAIVAIAVSFPSVLMAWEESDEFCAHVQRFMASTSVDIVTELYSDYEGYVESKPKVAPLTVAQYEYVAEDASGTKIISCKLKTADHIREQYGSEAAGEESTCAAASRAMLQAEWDDFRSVDRGLDVWIQKVTVREEKPAWIGPLWLRKLKQPLLFEDEGSYVVRAPGFHVDWTDWRFAWAPDVLRGNHYCHFVAPSSLRAAMLGQLRAQ